MMNSEDRSLARRALARILALLDEGRIAKAIDGPIKEAVSAFDPGEVSGDHAGFRHLVCAVVQDVRQRGLNPPQEISEPEAFVAGVGYLQSNYPSIGEDRIESALLDFIRDTHAAMDKILFAISKGMRSRERAGYERSVFRREFDSLDWNLRAKVVGVFLEDCGKSLPDEILGCSPHQFVDSFKDLLGVFLRTDGYLNQLVAR